MNIPARRRAWVAGTVAVALFLCLAAATALAEGLSPEQQARFMDIKNKATELMGKAAELQGSENTAVQQAAVRMEQNAQNTYNRAEAALIRNQQ